MRTLLVMAAGIWLGRKISTILAENRTRERELQLRRRLAIFIGEQMPFLRPAEVQKELKELFK